MRSPASSPASARYTRLRCGTAPRSTRRAEPQTRKPWSRCSWERGQQAVSSCPRNPQRACQRGPCPRALRCCLHATRPGVDGLQVAPSAARESPRQGGPGGPPLAGQSRAMCGIVGIVHSDSARPVPPAVIRRMCEAIRHRGPDDEGAYVDRNVGLGMRRLSIIDLAGGRHPIFNEDHSKVIVINGAIYNYRELRRGLIAQGHVFATQGGTEAILPLYEQYAP